MSKYKQSQYERQEELIKSSDVFHGDNGYGIFRKRVRPFVLCNGINNLYKPIQDEVVDFFKSNNISWWGGSKPTPHTLSSQIACLNHLFAIRGDKEAVLAMLNGIRDEFEDVLPIPCDDDPQYISFEVVSDKDHLNEIMSTRGSQCTSVDALIYAVHRGDRAKWLIPIEWKYTEFYNNQDKSAETNGRGDVRIARYSKIIDESLQLKGLNSYYGSVYYQEPFYQLMRQTLWAENVIRHKVVERLKADNFLHIHIIPSQNRALLDKKYRVSGKGMEETWRSMLKYQSKYVICDPKELFQPIAEKYPDLSEYLSKRYW